MEALYYFNCGHKPLETEDLGSGAVVISLCQCCAPHSIVTGWSIDARDEANPRVLREGSVEVRGEPLVPWTRDAV